MEDVDAPLLQDARKAESVGENGQRIFGLSRQLDQLAAGRLEVRLKATAGAGDQGEPPGAADRLRYFKRGPFDAASIKLRRHLQNRQDVTFLQCLAAAGNRPFRP